MGINNGPDRMPPEEFLSANQLEKIDLQLGTPNRLASDALTPWLALAYAPNHGFNLLHTIPHYGDYIRGAWQPAAVAEFLIQESDFAAIEAYNRLADDFNREMARIVWDQDVARVQYFYERAERLIRGMDR